LELRDGVGTIPFDWIPGDRCEIQVNNYTTPQGARAHSVLVRYKILVSAIDPRFLRLSWLTVPLPARPEGLRPLPGTFVIGLDGQPHPGIRDFPYITTGLEIGLWALSPMPSPTVIFTVIGALLALLGCVNWRGYCRGLGIGSETLPAFQSVTDYVGHSLEILVSPGALPYIALGAVIYVALFLFFASQLLSQEPVFQILLFGAITLGGWFGWDYLSGRPLSRQQNFRMIQIGAWAAAVVPPIALFAALAISIYPVTRHLLPARVPITIVIFLTPILICLWEAYIRGIYEARCLLLSPPEESKFLVSTDGQSQEVAIIRNFRDSILGLILSSKEIVVFRAADIRIQKLPKPLMRAKQFSVAAAP
jgi:hypothetical protein